MSIFDLTYGSAEAELLVKGSWTASLVGTAGLTVDSSGTVAMADEQPLLFTQVPDLYISFLLYKKLFAEIRVSEDETESKYSVGYKGGEGELLQELRIGNDGIDFPVLPYLSLGSGSYRSFGVAAKIQSGDFSGRAMVRYDQATRVEKSFVGSAEMTETVVDASGFVRGRWFALPLASGASVANLEVYAQSSSGSLPGSDSKTYRKMEASEFSYAAASGLLSLTKTATTRILAYFTGASGTVSVNSRSCLVLYDPDNTDKTVSLGASTLVLSRYSLSGGEGADAFVRDLATKLEDTDYSVTVDSAGYAQVIYKEDLDPQSSDYRQPFAKAMPWLYTTDFSSDTTDTTYAPAYSKELVIRKYATSSKISVDTDVIEGSVEVTRNGLPDYDFTLDTKSGTLTLGVSPGLDELIKVSYLRESSERSSGSLAAGLGGIFSVGKDSSSWAALGLRWSVPGTSYGSSGQSDPGKVVFTLGEKDGEGPLTQSLALAGQWSTEAASGRYRLEGMESSSTYTLSFRPLEGGSLFTAVETKDSLMATDWPTLTSALHADGSTQQALRLTADSSGSLVLAKYLETPTVTDYKVFSFYARAATSTTASTATLSVELDQGSTASAELSLSVPVSALDSTWRRFVLKYGYGSLTVYLEDGEGGSLSALGTATGSYNLTLTSASRLLVSLTDAVAGEVVWLDEILLEEAVGTLALLGKGSVAYKDDGFKLGKGLVSGISAMANASAGLSDSSYLSGGASVATKILDLGVELRTLGSLSSDSASLRGGHSLSLARPGLPLTLSEVFDSDSDSGSFGRKDSLGLTLGRVLGLSLSQTSSFAGASTGTNGLFSQSWSAKASLLASLLSFSLDAKSSGYPDGYAGLTSDYFDNWYQSILLWLPAQEASLKTRGLTLSGALSLPTGARLAEATATLAAKPLAASPTRTSEIKLKAQLPLRIGSDLLLAPYYSRTSTEKRSGAGDGLYSLGEASLSEAGANEVLWTSLPLAELFWDRATTASSYAQYLAAQGLSSASYAPELGLVVSRNFGSDLYDLFVPSALSVAWTRTYSQADSTFLSQAGLSLSLKLQAVNVFGAAGSHPLLAFIESDEYRTTLQVSYALADGDQSPTYSVILQNNATFYGSGSKDSLTVDNRFSWKDAPSALEWTETLDFSLALRTGRSFFLDLYEAILAGALAKDRASSPDSSPSPSPEVPEADSSKPKASVVSSWLNSLASATPVSKIVYAVSADIDAKDSDDDPDYLDYTAEESLTWKLILPDLLTVSFKTALKESLSGDTGLFEIAPELTLEAKVSF